MLFIAGSVLLFLILVSGVGFLAGMLLKLPEQHNIFIIPCLGLLVTGIMSVAVNFIIPLDFSALLVFAAVGLVGFVFFVKDANSKLATYRLMPKILFAGMLLVCLTYISGRHAYAIWPEIAFDTDLYHASLLQWINKFSIVPGLANLHERFGFNSSLLHFAALMDNGLWDNRSAFIVPSLVFVCLSGYFLYEIIFPKVILGRIYSIIYYPCVYLLQFGAPNLYYDILPQGIDAIIILEAIYMLENQKDIQNSALRFIVSLAALSFAVKPIGAVSVIFTCIICIYFLMRNKQITVKNLVSIFLPALCIGTIWVTRNIIVSGYILCPLPLGRLPLDWTSNYIRNLHHDVVNWAKLPGPLYNQVPENSISFWLIPWLNDKLSHFRSAMLITAFPIISLIAICRSLPYRYYFMALWGIANICFWFISAPDLRFGTGLIWSFTASSVAFACTVIPAQIKRLIRKPDKKGKFYKTLTGCAFLCMVFLCFWNVRFVCIHKTHSMLNVGVIPPRAVTSCYTQDSMGRPVEIFVAVSNYQCGNLIPCAPNSYVARNVRLRGTDLADGFALINK